MSIGLLTMCGQSLHILNISEVSDHTSWHVAIKMMDLRNIFFIFHINRVIFYHHIEAINYVMLLLIRAQFSLWKQTDSVVASPILNLFSITPYAGSNSNPWDTFRKNALLIVPNCNELHLNNGGPLPTDNNWKKSPIRIMWQPPNIISFSHFRRRMFLSFFE